MTINRRWLRFSLRTTIGLVALSGIVLALVIRPAQQHGRSIAAIRAAGGTVRFQVGPEASWLDRIVGQILGPDAVAQVFSVDLRRAKIDDDFLACFRALPELRALDLEDTPISDLEPLGSLGELRSLMVGGTAITDADLATLGRFPKLYSLSVQGTKITDAGLGDIAKLSGLTDLKLNATATTDQGLAKLVALKGLADLGLRGSKVTSDGLAYLKQMPKLKKIGLYSTVVDDAGVQHLAEIPTLQLVDLSMTRISDAAIRSLDRLPEIESLDVSASKVSAEALTAFKQSHPKCSIEAYGTPGWKP